MCNVHCGYVRYLNMERARFIFELEHVQEQQHHNTCEMGCSVVVRQVVLGGQLDNVDMNNIVIHCSEQGDVL